MTSGEVPDGTDDDNPFGLVERMGLEVLESRTLAPPVVLYRAHSIALIRHDLTAGDREAAADLLLAALACPVPAADRRTT